MNLQNIDFSNPTTEAILALAVLAVILIIAAIILHQRKTARLRRNFGAEYDRAVLEHGSERKAQTILAEREERVHKLTIRELGDVQRERFVADWATIQSRFVDFPKGAVIEADELVTSLLRARGYPVTGFEQGLEDISVDYPRLVEHYRSAHSIALLATRGEASTEELRNAMIQYRAIFDEVAKVGTGVDSRATPVRAVPTHVVR
jgi:hypothetical protein